MGLVMVRVPQEASLGPWLHLSVSLPVHCVLPRAICKWTADHAIPGPGLRRRLRLCPSGFNSPHLLPTPSPCAVLWTHQAPRGSQNTAPFPASVPFAKLRGWGWLEVVFLHSLDVPGPLLLGYHPHNSHQPTVFSVLCQVPECPCLTDPWFSCPPSGLMPATPRCALLASRLSPQSALCPTAFRSLRRDTSRAAFAQT